MEQDCSLCENASEYRYRIEENSKRIELVETRTSRSILTLEERMDARMERIEKLLNGFIVSALITVISLVLSHFI